MKKFFYLQIFILLTPWLLCAQIWTEQNPNYPQPLFGFDVEVPSATAAWTVGITGDFSASPWNIGVEGHYFSRTANGGATWKSGTFPSTGAGFTSNISAIDANVAWIAYVDYGDGNHIFKTVDGGDHWTDQNTVIDVWVNVVYFWDNAVGLTIGDPDSLGFQIATTSNGGNNWSRVPVANIPAALPGEFGITNNYCTANNGATDNSKVWFATNFGRVYYSANKGHSWTVSDPGANAFPDKVACDGYGHCLLSIGDYSDPLINKYQLWRTADAGVTWAEITSATDNEWAVVAIQYVPNGGGVVIGTFRHNNATGPFETRISYDHADTWITIDSTTKVFDLDFASPTVGWATEYTNTNDPTKIFKYASSPLVGLFSPNTLQADITLSPNPTSDLFRVHIQVAEPDDFILLLNDAQGRLVRKLTVRNTADFTEEMAIGNLPAGIYTLTVTGKGGSITRQLEKQ